ncbi:FtsW/RodA/SpoVE family cell cycle protein, partial [Lysinibacillus telephonicus]
MRKYLAYFVRNFDYPLFFTYVFLCLFGLVMIYSSSMMVSIVYEDGTPDYFYRKQLLNLVVAAFAFLIGAFFPYKHFSSKKLMKVLLFFTIFLFIWLLIDGYEAGGAKSWINL